MRRYITRRHTNASAAAVVRVTPIYWGARVSDTLYENAPYSIGPANMPPWSFPDPLPTPYSLFVQHAGGKVPSIIHWGGPGTAIGSLDTTALSRSRLYGAITLYSMAASAAQLSDLVNNVDTNGTLTLIDQFASDAKANGNPFFLRPWWEMNANWGQGWAWQETPGAGVTGVTSSDYVVAWRRLWQRIADTMGGATPGSGLGTHTGNISFVWCPNIIDAGSAVDPTPWWPGDAYVDWLGFDGYSQNGPPLVSAADRFNATVSALRGLSSKPIIICETGAQAVTGKAAWITDFLGAWLPSNTIVKAVVWFNQIDGTKLWPIEIGDSSSTYDGEAEAAFAAGIAASYFQSGGTDLVNSSNFPNGAKVPVPA